MNCFTATTTNFASTPSLQHIAETEVAGSGAPTQITASNNGDAERTEGTSAQKLSDAKVAATVGSQEL